MHLSIIVATYNRASALRQALDSLAAMVVPEEIAWEVVVVDNNSNDRTASVVNDFQQAGLPVRYVFEGKQGKSYALNTGIREAKGEILAFTDDDCLVARDWAAAIVKEFRTDHALAGLGGRVELYNPTDKPVSIRTRRERMLFSSLSFDHLFALIPGCNMAFLRKVFVEVGEFDPFFGPGAKPGAVAEDTEFLYRAYKKGIRMVYSPDVVVFHNHGRRTDEEVESLNRKYGIGRGALYCKHVLRGDREILKMAYWEISWTTKSLLCGLFSQKSVKKQRQSLWALFLGALYWALAGRGKPMD